MHFGSNKRPLRLFNSTRHSSASLYLAAEILRIVSTLERALSASHPRGMHSGAPVLMNGFDQPLLVLTLHEASREASRGSGIAECFQFIPGPAASFAGLSSVRRPAGVVAWVVRSNIADPALCSASSQSCSLPRGQTRWDTNWCLQKPHNFGAAPPCHESAGRRQKIAAFL